MKEPVWCCLFQPSRVVSKPGSSQYTVSLLWWWCNSSRYCTVKASSVRARSGRNRGGGRRWHRNVAKCAPSFPVLAENTAAEWLTKNECSQTRAWLSPPHDPQTAACATQTHLEKRCSRNQSSSRIKPRWLLATLLTDEVENFLKTWLAVHNIMALLFVFNIYARVCVQCNRNDNKSRRCRMFRAPSWGRRAPVFTRCTLCCPCEPDSAADRGVGSSQPAYTRRQQTRYVLPTVPDVRVPVVLILPPCRRGHAWEFVLLMVIGHWARYTLL